MIYVLILYEAPPLDSLMDSTTNPRLKTTKGKGVLMRSLVRNTLGVEGHARAPRWGLRKVTSKLITHTILHKMKQQVD
jgi:hypothetical protein